MNFLWYLAGLLTIPAVIVLWSVFVEAFSKTSGTGPCVVECRGSDREMEIGDHFNVTVWIASAKHRLFWSTRNWHKDAVKAYWQEIYDKGGQTRTDVGVNFHRD